MTNEEHINQIIEETFDSLNSIIKGNDTDNRLIFPTYKDGKKTRFCEQELRFVFVEVFLRYCQKNQLPWYYSIETPTQGDYGFSGNGKRSASIDLTIHTKEERLALIEFKAKMQIPAHFDKDFEKLEKEPGKSLRYFVMYFPSSDSGTQAKILEKINKKDIKTIFVCYDLKHNKYLIDERKKV